MTAISCTELKTNLKHYGTLVSAGETIMVTRPKDEPNWVIINEQEYKLLQRVLAYYKELTNSAAIEPPANCIYTDIDISKATTMVSEPDTYKKSSPKRNVFGCLKGKYKIPDDINMYDDEVAEMFGESEEDW